MVDILPDSRPRELRNAVKMDGVEMRPVYCASCGTPQGLVPVGMTYAFFLCDVNGCAEKYGHDAHFMKESDDVFWQRARELKEQEDKRLLAERGPTVAVDDAFLVRQLANSTSLWSKLKADFDRHLRRFAER